MSGLTYVVIIAAVILLVLILANKIKESKPKREGKRNFRQNMRSWRKAQAAIVVVPKDSPVGEEDGVRVVVVKKPKVVKVTKKKTTKKAKKKASK